MRLRRGRRFFRPVLPGAPADFVLMRKPFSLPSVGVSLQFGFAATELFFTGG